MSALFNLFYIYDPWFFHFVRMAFVAGILAFIYLSYKIYRKQQNGLIIPKDSLIAILSLIAFSVLPLIINQTKDYSVILDRKSVV